MAIQSLSFGGLPSSIFWKCQFKAFLGCCSPVTIKFKLEFFLSPNFVSLFIMCNMDSTLILFVTVEEHDGKYMQFTSINHCAIWIDDDH